MGPSSSFTKRGGFQAGAFIVPKSYANGGGPLELRFVAPQRDELVAVWYREYNPPPTDWPLLTMTGWYRGPSPDGTRAEDTEVLVRTFLAKALTSKG